MMTFSGVRSSCEMVARNSDFKWFARSSSSTFSSRAPLYSSSVVRLRARLCAIALKERASPPSSSPVRTSTWAPKSPRAIASAADRDEHEALAIEHPAVDDSALRASLLGEVPQTVDVAGEDADRRLLREVLPDRPTPLGQIPADVLEVALREDPALRDADDHDQ